MQFTVTFSDKSVEKANAAQYANIYGYCSASLPFKVLGLATVSLSVQAENVQVNVKVVLPTQNTQFKFTISPDNVPPEYTIIRPDTSTTVKLTKIFAEWFPLQSSGCSPVPEMAR